MLGFYQDGKWHTLGEGKSREELLTWIEIFIRRISWAEGTLRTIKQHDEKTPMLNDHCRKLLNSTLKTLDEDVHQEDV